LKFVKLNVLIIKSKQSKALKQLLFMYDIEIKMIKSKTKSSQIKKLIESENNKIERTTSQGLGLLSDTDV